MIYFNLETLPIVYEASENYITIVKNKSKKNTLCYCGLVAKLSPTLCDPMDCSTPGFLVLYYLPKFAQTQVHWVGDIIQPSRPLSPPSLSLNLSQHQSFFQKTFLVLTMAAQVKCLLEYTILQYVNINL